MEQIKKDLTQIGEKGFSKNDLTKVLDQFKNDPHVLYFEVNNNKVRFKRFSRAFQNTGDERCFYERLLPISKALKCLASHKMLPDLCFVLTLQDSLSFDTAGPIMTFAKNKNAKNTIAFPDFEAVRGYHLLNREIKAASSKYPFDQKIEKVFWRGTSTGGHYTEQNWNTFPRAIAALTSNSHPDLVDAKLTNLVQIQDPSVYKHMRKNRLKGSHATKDEHIQYKYLLDVDGNSCTYSRLYWILLSNSTCLKQITSDEQWYYAGLKPGYHYIPLKEDLSDLIEKVTWAKSHPKECEQIAKNATVFAETQLGYFDILKYIYLLLNEYAKLQKN
ncbi:MAG: hypothetical protein S4CHLAM37_16080 [Chlamydiia bacterium]|nr:hypothetical protein [Chlamydiia bacterium]